MLDRDSCLIHPLHHHSENKKKTHENSRCIIPINDKAVIKTRGEQTETANKVLHLQFIIESSVIKIHRLL